MKSKIFTLGYEKKNINEFISILIKSDVKILIDVRETAWSYKRDFCKSNFTNALNDKGITYLHVKKAGNPKNIRRLQTSMKERLKIYKNYLKQTQSGIEDIESIILAASLDKENICITCFEKEHTDCHRSVIVEFLKDSITNLEIRHLV